MNQDNAWDCRKDCDRLKTHKSNAISAWMSVWNCAIIDKDNVLRWLAHTQVATTREELIGTAVSQWLTAESADDFAKATRKARRAGIRQAQACRLVFKRGARTITYACTVERFSENREFLVVCGEQVPDGMDDLSERQMQIMILLKRYSPKEIASQLEISVSTVHEHLQRIGVKIGLETTDEIRAWAVKHF